LTAKHDDLPEQAFYMVGTIEEAIEEGEDDRSVGAMAKKIQLEVVTPERRVLAEPVDMVTVPAGVNWNPPGHTPLISNFRRRLTYVQDGKSYQCTCSGVCRGADDHVSVLAELPSDRTRSTRRVQGRATIEKQLNAWSGSEEDSSRQA
jgi:F0F1-type ATP synthase epsilon subunit